MNGASDSPAHGPVTDRRTLTQVGLAGAALAAAPLAAARAAASGSGGIYKAIYDKTYPEGAAFARQMKRNGVSTAAITGDITALWYDDLYHRWKKGPAAIAGLTDATSLFCLETLANDVGMRLAFRSEYRPASFGGIEHRARGPEALVETAAMLPAGRSWGADVARLVVACPLTPTGAAPVARASTLPSPSADTLVAWVIAPKIRV